MEFLYLIGLFVLITFFMPWVNHVRVGSLRDEIQRLQHKILKLEAMLNGQSPALNNKLDNKLDSKVVESKLPLEPEIKREPTQKAEKTVMDLVAEKAEKAKESNKRIPAVAMQTTQNADWVKTAQDSFERNIATKLPVWIGAISLIFAAFFMVKYSMESGFMTPIMRTFLGASFGITLLVAGQWLIKRDHIANYLRISQALVGAGLVALYVSVYAAINLYGLMPPMMGFISMAVITALAVILSLRHGQTIAIFGLLGGLLTPALVGSDEPNAIAMFSYLFVLFTGMFIVLVRKGWWLLALASLVGVFSWSVVWFLFAFADEDATVLLIFAIAILGVVLAVTGKRVAGNTIQETEKWPIHGLNFAAISGGILTILWLSVEVSLTLFDWSMLGLLSVAMMTLAYFKPSVYQRPLFVKLIVSLILFFMWSHNAPLTDAIIVAFGIVAVYVGFSAYIMRHVTYPRFWAQLQGVATIALFVLAYYTLDFPESFENSYELFWGFLGLALASISILQATNVQKRFTGDHKIQEHLVAIYALLASALISVGLAIELPFSYLPLAIAGQAAITALLYHKNKIESLKKIVLILVGVFAALSYDYIYLMIEVVIRSLEGRSLSTYMISGETISSLSIKLVFPALFIALAFGVFYLNKNKDKILDHILFGVALVTGLIATYLLFKYTSYNSDMTKSFKTVLSQRTNFVDRGIITLFLGLLGFGLLEGMKRVRLDHLKTWAIGLLILAGARYIYFDLLVNNPYWDRTQNVGNIPIFNGVTLTYGSATALFAYAVYSKNLISKNILFKVFGFISLFVFSSLTVRQYFNGGQLATGGMDSSELYAYSLVWLLTGLGLLTIGIVKEIKLARMASLAFLILAVVKVFLFDAAELEGLYRVFSFLGLGVSLIGLSYFYSKFVFDKKI